MEWRKRQESCRAMEEGDVVVAKCSVYTKRTRRHEKNMQNREEAY